MPNKDTAVAKKVEPKEEVKETNPDSSESCRTHTVLERCKMSNITISRKKFEMGKEIEFAGHIISDTGIRPDEKKFAATKQFPTPSCIREVRAFLGLANQLGSFIADLAHMTSTI